MTTASPPHVAIEIGGLRLEVPVGYAAAQRVPWLSRRWATKLDDWGIERRRAAKLIHAVTKSTVPHGDGRAIPRAALRALSAAGDFEVAYFAVMAWGIGDRDWFRMSRNVRLALESKSCGRLADTMDAVPEGLGAMWDAHFAVARRPQGMGRVSYGSKWLYAAGFGRIPGAGPQPVVFDQFVHAALTRCGGFDLAYPSAPTTATRDAWIEWCSQADAAATGGLSAEDVERAVFDHGRSCLAAKGQAAACDSGGKGPT